MDCMPAATAPAMALLAMAAVSWMAAMAFLVMAVVNVEQRYLPDNFPSPWLESAAMQQLETMLRIPCKSGESPWCRGRSAQVDACADGTRRSSGSCHTGRPVMWAVPGTSLSQVDSGTVLDKKGGNLFGIHTEVIIVWWCLQRQRIRRFGRCSSKPWAWPRCMPSSSQGSSTTWSPSRGSVDCWCKLCRRCWCNNSSLCCCLLLPE